MRALAYLLISLLAYVGCEAAPAPTIDAYQPALAAAVGVTANNTPKPEPTPTPSGKCDNCGGTGRVGDGTVFVVCPVCNGTGKLTTAGGDATASITADPPEVLTPEPINAKGGDLSTADCCDALFDELRTLRDRIDAMPPPPQESIIVAKPTLTFVTGANCPPCEAFKRDYHDRRDLRDYIDTHFELVEVEATGKQLRPRFTIGDTSTLGYQNAGQLLDWLKRHNPHEEKPE